MTRPRLAAAALAACLTLATPAAAQASFTAAPSPATATQAGSHQAFAVHADFANDPTGGPLTLHLPPGLVGNPRGDGIGFCTEAGFRSSSCPANARVGTAQANGGAATGGIYNLVAQAGEPARLGIEAVPLGLPLLGTAYNEAAVKVRPDGGLDSTIASLNTTLGQAITSLDLTLDASFMTLPTSCDPAVTRIDAANNPSQQASFTPTGCSAVPFDPVLHAQVDRFGPKGARNKPTLRTSITLPAGQAAIRKAVVALPKRITLDLDALKSVCSVEQAAADTCPDASAVGSVTAVTPLLGAPLSGPVNTVMIPGSVFPGLRLALNGLATLRFTAPLDLSKTIAAGFDGLPDVPLSSFDLAFAGGGALRLRGSACGGPLTFTGEFTGHNGATVTRTVTASVPNCPATAAVALSKGKRPRLRTRLDHGRDAGPLGRAVIKLPRGLTARRHGLIALTGDGKRLGATPVRITRHRLVLTLPSVSHATLSLGRGVLRGRPHGRFTVKLTRTDGKTFSVHRRATRLR